ncbi:MAG TPA: hypothetical protein VHB98_21605, partial [Chloroflexota bacterium]|nr:hypothetical protein [Chloroflexota bacterium]
MSLVRPLHLAQTSDGDSLDRARYRALLSPLAEQILKRWQDWQVTWGFTAPDAPPLLEFHDLLDGLLSGQVPDAVWRDLAVRVAARGLDGAAWAAAVGALLDCPFAALLEHAADPDDLRLAARFLTALRPTAVQAAVDALRRQTARPTPAGTVDDANDMLASVLQRILTLSASIGSEAGLAEFSRQFVQVSCEIGGFPYAVLFFYDAADDAFYAEARQGVGAEDWQEILAAAVPRRIYDRVLSARVAPAAHIVLAGDDPLLLDAEVAACFEPLGRVLPLPAPPHAATAPPRHALLLMPLAAPDRGLIGFYVAALADGVEESRPATMHALQALARLGAVFVENSDLYRLQEEEAAVSSALLQVASVVGTTDIDLLVQRTLGVLPRLFGGQVAALLYLDHRRSELRLLEPKGPDGPLTALTEVQVARRKLALLEPVLRGAAPVAIEEAEIAQVLPASLVRSRALRSALIIPLHLSNRPADALGVFWSASPHRFRARDLETARGVSELVGVALTNAQLFTEASDRAEQLSSLYRTGQMMSSSLDLDGLLRTITAAAVELTRSKVCVICLIDPHTGMLELAAGSGLDPGQQPGASFLPADGLLGR